jgi:long-chain fatty acid transport protein
MGRGGAYVVGADDATAIYYNPALLAKQRGTSFLYNHNVWFHDTRFQRAPLSDAWGSSAGTTFPEARDRTRVFPLQPYLAVASDFGLKNWTFGAAITGPSGIGRHEYADYGPQSFMMTKMRVLMSYYMLSAAWKWRDVFGVGATLQYVDLISLRYGLVVDSTRVPGLNPVPDGESTQLVSDIVVKDRFAGTALLGLWYKPHPRVELAFASQIAPVNLNTRGRIEVDKETLVPDDVTVKMPLVLPAKVRGGVRYIHLEGGRQWFDLELSAYWENWAAVKSFEVDLDGQIAAQDVNDLSIPKKWRDTVSVRLGGDVNVLPKVLTVRAGGFFETAAASKNYSHLDFPSFTRGGISAGVTGGFKGVYLTVAYTHIFQDSRNVTEAFAKIFQQRPLLPCPDGCGGASGVPANAGKFTSRMDLLSLGLDIRFAELLAGVKARRERGRGPAHAG